MLIELKRTARCYTATYSGEGADEIIEAFGTDTIPTAFTSSANPNEVQSKISALNPKAAVCLI